MKLTLLTYNIHKGFCWRGKKFILPGMREALRELHPDIVLMQEVQGVHHRKHKKISDWPSESQVEFLAQSYWPHFVYEKNGIYKNGHHGNGIMSKYPIEDWENINLSSVQRASRSLLHVTFNFPHSYKTLHVICAHLGLFEAERERQFSLLSDCIEARIPHDEPLIIAGDFNDWRQRARQHLREHLNLREAFSTVHGRVAKTFPSFFPLLRVDRIYYRGVKIVEAKCLPGQPWSRLSDHLPLMAEIEI